MFVGPFPLIRFPIKREQKRLHFFPKQGSVAVFHAVFLAVFLVFFLESVFNFPLNMELHLRFFEPSLQYLKESIEEHHRKDSTLCFDSGGLTRDKKVQGSKMNHIKT